MKALVLAPPLVSQGGIQRYTRCLVGALREVLGEQNLRCVAISESRIQNEGARFSLGRKVHFGLQAITEFVRWQPDLIICTHLALAPIGRWLAHVHGRPCWVVVHGIEAWASLPYWKRTALRDADRVVTTSIFSRDIVAKRHQIDPESIASLPCMLDSSLLSVEPSRNKIPEVLSDGRPVILTVARMVASERYKGHDVVLQALPAMIAEVPRLAYVVVGDGDDRPRLERLAQELGLTGHVLFTGAVSESELAALYDRSDVFVLPARTVIDDRNPKGEGFGIVFLEAMAFGKPVLGPNYGAPAELIRDGENGLLVDPDDPTAVAQAIIKLLTNPDLARTMGQAGSERVRAHYSYERFRERLRQLLSS
jgi:glycosyltransferase involved in cell wall biosynthesis